MRPEALFAAASQPASGPALTLAPCCASCQGLMSQADWDAASSAALALFNFGQQEAAKRGLLLVDTKYEFGKDAHGSICLIDEVRVVLRCGAACAACLLLQLGHSRGSVCSCAAGHLLPAA
jgi:hypothetical protein